jgi:hypothetical protein
MALHGDNFIVTPSVMADRAADLPNSLDLKTLHASDR